MKSNLLCSRLFHKRGLSILTGLVQALAHFGLNKQKLSFPGGSDRKESACNAGDLGSVPGLERHPGEGEGYTVQYSGLDCIVHGVSKSWICLRDFHFHFA